MTRKLPKIESPIFTTTLPIAKKEVRYRGYTVKEEKIMLIAKQADDPEQSITSIEQVLNNCIVDDIDIDELSIVDFTWMLIELRSKSVNDKILIQFKDDETEEEVQAEISIDQTKVVWPEEVVSSEIAVDEYKIFLKYPGFKTFKELLKNPDDPEIEFKTLTSSMEKIATAEGVMYFKDFNEEEILEFIDSLPDYVPEEIKKFYMGMPQLVHEIKYTRKSDKKERTLKIEGFDAFFI